MTYQVGDLMNFGDNDPVFDTLQAAADHARKLSEDEYESTFGLWTGQEDGSELLAIFHAGEGYWK